VDTTPYVVEIMGAQTFGEGQAFCQVIHFAGVRRFGEAQQPSVQYGI
jgi:hypothetical protein